MRATEISFDSSNMPGSIKGTVLDARKQFVRERFGDEALDRILASMPAEDQRILRGVVVPVGWYPSTAFLHFDEAIIATIGGESEKAFRELGRQSADHNLGKYQTAYVRGKTPQSFLAQAGRVYKTYYGVGSREYVPTGEKSGELVTRGAEDVTAGDCLTVMGWHERALEMVGAKEPRVEHPECRALGGEVCRYTVTWN